MSSSTTSLLFTLTHHPNSSDADDGAAADDDGADADDDGADADDDATAVANRSEGKEVDANRSIRSLKR